MDNKELIEKFLKVRTLRELAPLLGVEYKVFVYNLYKIPLDKKYITFEVPKKSGGKRLITAPNSGIKYIQRRLNTILQDIYPAKSVVHGFVRGKSIMTNARIHLRQNIVLNIDLQDFFPSIHIGRVKGLFSKHPFYFNKEITTCLAQICCFDGYLPQGDPPPKNCTPSE